MTVALKTVALETVLILIGIEVSRNGVASGSKRSSETSLAAAVESY